MVFGVFSKLLSVMTHSWFFCLFRPNCPASTPASTPGHLLGSALSALALWWQLDIGWSVKEEKSKGGRGALPPALNPVYFLNTFPEFLVENRRGWKLWDEGEKNKLKQEVWLLSWHTSLTWSASFMFVLGLHLTGADQCWGKHSSSQVESQAEHFSCLGMASSAP